MTLHPFPFSPAGKLSIAPLLCLLVLLMGGGMRARGEAEAPPPAEDFGKYLYEHQSDLAPFLDRNRSELLGQAVPLLLQWMGRIVVISLAVGWGVDCLLGRGFATLFAPARGRFRSAVVYATGRLALNVIVVIFLGSAIVASVGKSNLETVLIFLLVLFMLIAALLQVSWIRYLYRTNLSISILFYLTLVVVHGFLTLGIARPLSRQPASPAAIAFMDKTVAPKVAAEAARTRGQLAAESPDRDDAVKETARLRGQLDSSRAEQAELRKQIDDAKDSGSYRYSQIVKIHAQGNLVAARDQFAALLERQPSGPLSGLVRGQLTQVNSELAAETLQRQEAAASKARADHLALATLLARAGQGKATLSELRSALLGKTPAQVSALFGPPSETASNRWGFSRQMVFNPLTSETSGLAVYFNQGAVQGVDYYYATRGGP